MSKARGPYRVDPLRYKKANEALDKMAENARELGLDYDVKSDHRLMEQPAPVAKPHEQKPVAAECKFDREEKWVRCEIAHHNLVQSETHKWPGYQTRLLYTRPQAREPLTYEELAKLVSATLWRQDESMHTYAVRACRAIEAAHGIGEKK